MCAAVHGMHMCSTGREIGGQLVVFHTYVGMLYMIPRHVIPRVHARSQPIDRRLAIVLRAWTICWPGSGCAGDGASKRFGGSGRERNGGKRWIGSFRLHGMGRAAASIVVQVDRRRLLDGWCGPVDVYTPSFGAGPIR